MDIKRRIALIQLLSDELTATALSYDSVLNTKGGYQPGYGYAGINHLNCRTSLKRRIMVLREELLELSKKL